MAIGFITVRLLAFEVLGASSLNIRPLVDQHSMSPYICFKTHPEYNSKECEQGAFGMSLEILREKVFGHVELVGPRKPNCIKRFKVFRISEIEAKFPSLASCWLSTYAGKLQHGVQNAECQAETIEEADAIYMPAYLAQECNWPHYGGGNCNHEANTFRRGQICRKEALEAANLLQQEHGKPVIINDMHPLSSIDGHEVKHIWARLNLLTDMFIEGHTISQPPPPVWPRCQVCATTHTTECYAEALNQKKYKISFKGNLKTNLIRAELSKLYHNPKEKIIIVDNGNQEFDFDEILFHSTFVLIPRGEAAFTYRFTEAVCSGGVPVLIADDWVPPFDRSVPFKSYGIKVSEISVRGGLLISILDRYNLKDLEEMRLQARSVCENSLNKVEMQGQHMISEALNFL